MPSAASNQAMPVASVNAFRLEVGVPVTLEELGDLLTVVGQAGLLEEVGAVADASGRCPCRSP
jgi:hypothetical protein